MCILCTPIRFAGESSVHVMSCRAHLYDILQRGIEITTHNALSDYCA